jgi:hypothetical protein
MSTEFESIFVRLRSILQKHAANLWVKEDAPDRYRLESPPGPATLEAWAGKIKKAMIPVAWVEIGKAYVSYHLIGVYGNANLRDRMSTELKVRMQGKTCFNFKSNEEPLFRELEDLTADALEALKKAGYLTE